MGPGGGAERGGGTVWLDGVQGREHQSDAPAVACLPKPNLPRGFKGDKESSAGLARPPGVGLQQCLWSGRVGAGQAGPGRRPGGFSGRSELCVPKAAGAAQQAQGAAAERGGCVRAPDACSEGPWLPASARRWRGAGRRLCPCSVLRAKPRASSAVAQERRDFGVGDAGAALGHPAGTRGGQELPVPAAWREKQRPLPSQGSPLFQGSTRQGFKEGNQIAAYGFALSVFWI